MNRNFSYPVVETFYSFQGEGVHMGRAAFFVRLYGCDQKCPFCDSANTWHPRHKPKKVSRFNATRIVQRTKEAKIDRGVFIVLTGGEPSLYPLAPLIEAFWNEGHKVHIETAGHHALPESVDWVTLSPKVFAKAPLRENIQRAHEFKIIVENETSLNQALEVILPDAHHAAPIWLHPEWSQRQNSEVLNLITRSVKSDPRLRAGYQLHKLFKADLLDPNALTTVVPLGGEASRGNSQ